MEKIIVMAADNDYLDKITTVIKSVSMHNNNIKFYVFNDNIAPDWFRIVNKNLQKIGSEIIDIKLYEDKLKQYVTHSHINYAAYYRYFIPEYISADIVLYLDSDVLITTNIDELFQIKFKDEYIAAVKETWNKEKISKDINNNSVFNNGIMVINNKKWREDNFTERLLKLTEENHDKVFNGDQSICNMLIEENYIELAEDYNYQVGFDLVVNYNPERPWLYENLEDRIPSILHFLSRDKPWNAFNTSRFRELWWDYYELEWSTIVNYWTTLPSLQKNRSYERVDNYEKILFTLTTTEALENFEYLIKKFPNYRFEVAAYTDMSNNLKRFSQYSNVRLHQQVLKHRVEHLLENCDIYLDIHYGEETDNILARAKDKGKTILAFDSTVHNREIVDSENIISSLEPEKMVEKMLK